ncbi:HpcH/HpaI aldolase/citrate lyase family protein [Ottowia thiooxydans]|uniref:Citrate lyase subunit beta/citryl-CoA lyase n=1 Tax=Ottowia thiooxydans TaxID=219182 RepID=A0ABV2Q5X2_9BURK
MSSSLLFVPGTDAGKFGKALASKASALILDLEDSVRPAEKGAARAQVADWVAQARPEQPLWVRVNPESSGLLLEDLAAIVKTRPFGIVLPKCCGRDSLQPVVHYLDAFEAAANIERGSTRILAIVTETAASMFRLGEFAGATPRLWGITWGAEDLGADVGSLENADDAGYTEPFRLARSLCLFGAASAGVHAIDTVCVALRDDERILQESRLAFRDGFTGKLAIHPAQLKPIHAGFVASAKQQDWAARVVAGFEGSPAQGALQLDGKMLDQPHLRLARRILGGAS